MKRLFLILLSGILCLAITDCSKQMEVEEPNETDLSRTSAEPNELSIGPEFINLKYDDTLYLGKSSDSATKLFCKPNKEGYLTLYDNTVFINSINGRIVYLLFQNDFLWETQEQIKKGTPKSEIRAFYGEPEYTRDAVGKIEEMDSYDIKTDKDLVYDFYRMQFTYDKDESVTSIAVFFDIPKDLLKGTILIQESGTGDEYYEHFDCGQYGILNISNMGNGNFFVRAFDSNNNQDVLVDTNGNFCGVFSIPNFYPFSLEIKTDGVWSIYSMFGTNLSDKSIFSGIGDNVTDSFNFTVKNTEWKITNGGKGRFIIKLHYFNITEVLVETIGNFSQIVKSELFDNSKLMENGSYPAYFEVRSDGEWTIEPIRH